MANLTATVTDDGLPNPPGSLTTTWSKISGPGDVTFGNVSAANTTAAFSESGVYVLRLTAYDGMLTGVDELTVTVNPPPGTVVLERRVSHTWMTLRNDPTRATKASSPTIKTLKWCGTTAATRLWASAS